MSDVLIDKLQKRAQVLDVHVDAEQARQLICYLRLLEKWNKAFNLTSIRDIEEMLERHLVDSLSIARFIKENNVLDVGTGPGLPGIPLAILYPRKNIHLLDSNGKKTRFLNQVKLELNLKNIEVIQNRVEAFQPERKFEAIISRAFSSLNDMLEKTNHLLLPRGTVYAMKGVYPHDEITEINQSVQVEPISWKGNDKARHLVIISDFGE